MDGSDGSGSLQKDGISSDRPEWAYQPGQRSGSTELPWCTRRRHSTPGAAADHGHALCERRGSTAGCLSRVSMIADEVHHSRGTERAPHPRELLFALFQGGGNLALILPIVKTAVARGHTVRVLAGP